jgi:hypothetical protein
MNRQHPRIAALLLLACSAAASAEPVAEWPGYRGPTGDGHAVAKNLPLDLNDPANLAWKTPIPGKAWASPVIWDRLVWLANASDDGTRLSAVAVACDSGRVIHDITVFEIATPQFCHAFNSYASCTPVIERDRLYLHYGSAGTACLDTESGKILWTRQDLPCDHFRERLAKSEVTGGRDKIPGDDGRSVYKSDNFGFGVLGLSWHDGIKTPGIVPRKFISEKLARRNRGIFPESNP